MIGKEDSHDRDSSVTGWMAAHMYISRAVNCGCILLVGGVNISQLDRQPAIQLLPKSFIIHRSESHILSIVQLQEYIT
jgi:hypothetical protein